MTKFSFGRTERGNNNIPEVSLESAGILNHHILTNRESLPQVVVADPF